jgi:protein subunit release factor B
LPKAKPKFHINEADLIEKFILGSGKGGQKLHKTASTVYLKHLPSGLEIKCQGSRSREDNRYFARERLCEKLQAIFSDEKTKEQQRIEKILKCKTSNQGVGGSSLSERAI